MKKKSVFRIVNLLSIVAVWSLILVSCGNKGNVKDLRNVILGNVILDNNNNPTEYCFIVDTLLHQVGIADKMGNVIIEPKYIGIMTYFFDDREKTPIANVITPDTLFGLLDLKGKTLAKPEYEVKFGVLKDGVTKESFFINKKKATPNLEYKIKAGDGTTRTIVDDSPSYQYGVYDNTGRKVVPFEFSKVEIPVNGFFKVERTDKTGEKLYGIYKDGKEVAETKYQGVKIDPQGKGAVLYGKSDGRRNYKEIYLLDFKNNKTTPFPYSRWGDGDIKNGWVRKVVRNSRGADEDEYYDFSGEKVL